MRCGGVWRREKLLKRGRIRVWKRGERNGESDRVYLWWKKDGADGEKQGKWIREIAESPLILRRSSKEMKQRKKKKKQKKKGEWCGL